MNATAQHKHGDLGDRHVTRNIRHFSMSETSSIARWCDVCKEWKHATSMVGLVLMSVGCPACNTPWERKEAQR